MMIMPEFRAIGINDNNFYYGFVAQEIPETLETYIMPQEVYNCYEYQDEQMNWALRFEKYQQVKPETVCQWTGENPATEGVKIYTGDIVKIEFMQPCSDPEKQQDFIGIVKQLEGCFMAVYEAKKQAFPIWSCVNRVVKLGDIYNNPELMGDKNE